MEQTKPVFILRKFSSILRAAIIVDGVSFIVSLTDSIVAGNCLGQDALAAIGLISPFLFFSTFFSSIINSGTILIYSYEIGRFEKRRAVEIFSQGIWFALLTGFVYAAVLFLARGPVIACITGPGPIREYAREYYTIILLFFFLSPISFLLDNMLVLDGGEKLSAAANVLQISANLILSFLFAFRLGIQGIAVASVLSKLMFVLSVCLSFRSRNNTLQLLRRWNWQDCLIIIRSGIVKASYYALEAVLTFILNFFALHYFSDVTLLLIILDEKYLGLLTVFIGMSMAAQPLIGTLRGENNTKALYYLMKRVFLDTVIAGAILTVLTLVFTPSIIRVFGITEAALRSDGAVTLRIIGAAMIPQALSVMFFIYYYLIGENRLSFLIVLLRSLLNPLLLAIVFSLIMKSDTGIWIGLSMAPVLTLIATAVTVCKKYGRKEFPFLIPSDWNEMTFIYDFVISPETAAEMSKTADRLLQGYSVSKHIRNLVSLYIEEILILILAKNKKAPRINAECTIMVEPTGVCVILRDSGVIFDIADEDSLPDSFSSYVVSNLMVKQADKAYLVTTGYNRIELFFADDPSKKSL